MSRLDVKPGCVFLTCPFSGDHSHPVCDECGTVNYANPRCQTCRTLRPAYDARIAQGWEDHSPPHTAEAL